MSSSIDLPYILRLAAKALQVGAVAGLVGFLLATALGYPGVTQAEIQVITEIAITSSAQTELIDQRRDSQDDSSNRRPTKADRLHEPVPPLESTQFLTQKQAKVETAASVELNEPLHLVPWLQGESVTLSEVKASEPVVITPELLDNQLIGSAPTEGLRSTNPQRGLMGLGSTLRATDRASGTVGRAAGVAGKASGTAGRAAGVAGKASGALGF